MPEIVAMDCVIFLVVGIVILYLCKMLKKSKKIDNLADGIVNVDVINQYDQTLELAEKQLSEAKKEEESLKQKQEKIKTRIVK